MSNSFLNWLKLIYTVVAIIQQAAKVRKYQKAATKFINFDCGREVFV